MKLLGRHAALQAESAAQSANVDRYWRPEKIGRSRTRLPISTFAADYPTQDFGTSRSLDSLPAGYF